LVSWLLRGREFFANFAGVTYIHIIISLAMKSVFQKMSALLTVFAMMFAFILTSCGDDDGPDPDPQPTHPAKIGVSYTLNLGDAWWDYFDTEVTYTTVEGRNVTATVQKGWRYAASARYDEAASEYQFKAKATPKASLSAIDDDATYNLDREYNFTAFALKDNDTQESVITTAGSSHGLHAPGSKFPAYAAKSHDLASGSWTIKK